MFIKRLFHRGVNFLTEPHLSQGRGYIHAAQNHILTMLTTGALMWAYAIVGLVCIPDSPVGVVGLIASAVHLVSPLLYRFVPSPLFNASVMLGAGMLHQGTFAYYTGGFMGRIIIWFGILPFLGAIIAGTRGAVLWFLITTLGTGTFFALHLAGHPFPDLISDTGRIVAQAFIAFGWIGLSSLLSFAYLYQQGLHEKRLNKQKANVETLFRILFHDLGNPLSLLQMAMENLRLDKTPERQERSLAIASRAVLNMVEITENVRRMYAVNSVDGKLQCDWVELAPLVEKLRDIFQRQLQDKAIELTYCPQTVARTRLWVEPKSFVNQVLANIVSNAIKFSHEGSRIELQVSEKTPGKIELAVCDQGLGMPEDILRHLFSEEVQTSRPGTRGERGSGFGMPLMKTFVERYDGEVRVRTSTTAPSGTQFILQLKGKLT